MLCYKGCSPLYGLALLSLLCSGRPVVFLPYKNAYYIVLEASPEASKTRFVDKARSVLDLRESLVLAPMTGGNETVNQGPHRGDAGPSSIQNSESDSGSWRKYLTLSSEIEVNQTPGRQAPPLPIESGTVPPANAVAFSEAGPSQVAPPAPSSTPSNSSTWIERWLYPEVAPNEGGQPQDRIGTRE